MREILAVACDELAAGRAVAVATVVAASGSSPRELGASMLVATDGRAVGNVSAGCVDGAVYERCVEALAGAGPTIDRFGIADDDAFAAGLSCGGSIEVLVRAIAPGSADATVLHLLAVRERDAVPTVLRVRTAEPGAGTATLIDAAARDTPQQAQQAQQAQLGSIDLVFGAPPRLIVVGAVEVAVSLSALGSAAGFRVTVVDPREVFARAERFPGAEVVVDQPGRYLAGAGLDERAAVCVLTHDPKFDVPALAAALSSPARYVGAMGSRATCADRIRRLADTGTAPTAIARLRSPIGLDLGGTSAAEVALSILAEIVADRHGGTGQPLRDRTGTIHRGADSGAALDRGPGAGLDRGAGAELDRGAACAVDHLLSAP